MSSGVIFHQFDIVHAMAYFSETNQVMKTVDPMLSVGLFVEREKDDLIKCNVI